MQPRFRARHYLLFALGPVLLALSLGAAPAVLTRAQVAREFSQRVWMPEHGLPDSRVSAIHQTSDGYLWVGTQRGLARFDGRKFTVFDHNNTPELADDNFTSLAESADGALWVWTRAGVVRVFKHTFTRFQVIEEAGRQAGVCRGPGGGVYGYNDGLFWYFNGSSPKLVCDQPQGIITGMDLDHSGDLWLSTWGGLVRYRQKERYFEYAPLKQAFEQMPALALGRGIGGERWVLFGNQIAPPSAKSNRVWLACFKDGKWLRSVDPAREDLRSTHGEWFATPDAFGSVWLSGPVSGSLYRFTGHEFQDVPLLQNDNGNHIICAYMDREGSLWLGTEAGGLHCLTPRRFSCLGVGEGLPSGNTWSITEARDGAVWVGTDAGVCRVYNGEVQTFLNGLPHPESNVRAVVEDVEGTIWVGTIRGLHRIDRGGLKSMKLPGEWFETKVRALQPSREGGIWVGTVRGLTRLKGGQRVQYTTSEGMADNEVLAVLEGRDSLWVGTARGGLSRLHQGRFSTLSTTNGLCSNEVSALYEDSDGVLWIGTEAGLNRLEHGRLISFTVAQGLPENQVNCLLEDDFGRLWIGHDHGIYQVRKQQLNDVAAGKLKSVASVSYDESDGLPGNEVNGRVSYPVACKTRDGRLWFPTIRGVAIVDPARSGLDDVPPLMVIEEMRANAVRVPLSAGPSGDEPIVRLEPGKGRMLEFRYTANAFVAPDQVRFRYRLAGLSDAWVENGTRRDVHFADLRPGSYRLEVMAANSRGVWSAGPASLAFQISPFYYQTVWFYVASGAILGGLIALGVSWRVRDLRRIHELEQANALNEQRKRIARDVHDELGASLTHILQLSRNENFGDSINESPARRIACIAEAAVDNIGEIVWANNPEFDTLPDLVAYLREYAANFLASTTLEVKLEFPQKVPDRAVSGLMRRHLLLLLKEALQNIVKHAEARRVHIELRFSAGELALRVSDDGAGFALERARPPGNGILNMRSRVEELGGTFSIRSEPCRGTEVSVRVVL